LSGYLKVSGNLLFFYNDIKQPAVTFKISGLSVAKPMLTSFSISVGLIIELTSLGLVFSSIYNEAIAK
jgi:hypothetical protein